MFNLNKEQLKKLDRWNKDQENIVRQTQKLKPNEDPYYGAIGGQLTYSFTPTSLGVIEKIHHCVTKNELDLTEYDLW